MSLFYRDTSCRSWPVLLIKKNDMENITSTAILPPVKGATVKDQLELIDKKLEILKKRVEIRKERFLIEKLKSGKEEHIMEQELILQKLYELRQLLTDFTIDDERTILASSPFLKPALNENRREMIARKIMELVNKL